ncbi:hypothetical protein [Streptococcus suis]|uniref:Transcriptional regulator n=1 Tax=Streptococcus suis TaxID=1307 RepID=A0A426T4J1_STRSU|nr:hypothetical protein [Streptococcus suis]MBY4965178.1 transcriptional regulator [Streptococcus suis]MCK4043635.1 transcriptional regulator [Streptococcus suis]MDW8777722.1 transcriptional regulator [Streptococcus suis]RRN52505.1 transcriptional regulator [Streptococcus suis]RRR48778.1 transcriptional regulator [Streptococcus suis]
MTEACETTLILSYFYLENGQYTRNEKYISAKRRKAIALLDEDREELEELDSDLVADYQETIDYLDSLSDEEYQSLKDKIVSQVEAATGA